MSTAFSPTSVPLQPTAQPSQPKTAESNALDLPPLPESKAGESSSSTDDWKSEYESQVQTWRAQSAEAREKEEKERNRWEGIREAEKRDAEQRKAEGKSVHVEGHETGWETVSQGQASHTTSSGRILTPSPVDARELVPGEIPRDFSKVRNICHSGSGRSSDLLLRRMDLLHQSPQSDLRGNLNGMTPKNGKTSHRLRPHFPLRRSQNAPLEHLLNLAPETVRALKTHLPFQPKHPFLRHSRYSTLRSRLEPAFRHYSHLWLSICCFRLSMV